MFSHCAWISKSNTCIERAWRVPSLLKPFKFQLLACVLSILLDLVTFYVKTQESLDLLDDMNLPCNLDLELCLLVVSIQV